MAMFEWKDEFSVNVKEIDDQHGKLVSMINELYDSMSKGHSKDVMSVIINGLAEYTAFHFQTEEHYFDQFKYNLSINHKMEHKEFVKKVTEFKNDFEKGITAVSIDVMNFLKEWLTKHILGTDKKYMDCFKSNGLS